MNSLEKKLIAAIGAVVLLLMAASAISIKTITDSTGINEQVVTAHEIVSEAESTLSILKDAESAQRGYILTGRKDTLEHYYTAGELTTTKLAHLTTLVAGDKRQQEKLATILPLIRNKLERIRNTIDIRKEKGFEVAKEEILKDKDQSEMDIIRHILDGIVVEENEVLQNRIAKSEQSMQDVTVSFASIFILILFLLFLVFFLVKKDVAIQRSLREKLSDLATIDELTTLYNRREINRCFRDEVARFQRHGQLFSLLLLDVDDFKSVNDKYGHQIGDEVLQGVAFRIRDGSRSIDVAGRFGGEEFAVILPNTNSYDAFVIAERMRSAIAREPFKIKQANGMILAIPVTISIGVSAITDDDETEEAVIRTADRALYRAKIEGRDRTVMFEQMATLQ